ncbi:MAG: sugar transferase [Patescibacteria group bacterium]
MKKIILLVFDLLAALAALGLALYIRYQVTSQVDYSYLDHARVFMPVFLLWLVIYFIHDLYDYYQFSHRQQLLYATLRSAVASLVVTIIFFYIIPKLQITPKIILLLLVSINALIIGAGRLIFNRIWAANQLLKRMIIVGNDKTQTYTAKMISQNTAFGFKLLGLVVTNRGRRSKLKILGPISKLETIIKRRQVDVIALDINSFRQDDDVFRVVSDVGIARQIEVVDINYLYEQLTGKVSLENISQIWFTNFNQTNNKFTLVIKRLMDIWLATIGLLVLTILLPWLYVLVKLDSPGAFWFRQERLGGNNIVFTIYKIRTMTLETSGDPKSKWNQLGDKRVTAAGRWLRKLAIDELPQCWNILRGEMSIVGPRPERPIYIAKLDKRQKLYYKRHLVKPGLTGWAQVNMNYGASYADADEKLQYDLYYVKNRSLFLDLMIILKTIRRVFDNRGGN